MAKGDEILNLDVVGLAAKLRTRELSPVAAGNRHGTFHGVPIALKDLCCIRGIPTTSGSKVRADYVLDFDATMWTRLQAAGAIPTRCLPKPVSPQATWRRSASRA